MTKYYNDKVVIITGAGSGMGRAYALAFARLGAKLGLNDYDQQSLAETIQLILKQTPHCLIVAETFDVSDQKSFFNYAERCKQKLGHAFVVINNAGIEGAYVPTWLADPQDYQKVMQINFFGVLYGTLAFLPQLISTGKGHIVNVSSIFGLVGTPNHSDYCASKFAVRGFSEALICELQHTHIKVHLLHPGGISTNIIRTERANSFSKNYLKTSPEAITEYLLKHIEKGTPRIVYGNSAFKTWLGSRLLSLKQLNKIIWANMKNVIDQKAYDLSPKIKKDFKND